MKIIKEFSIKPKDYKNFLEEQQCLELDGTSVKKEHYNCAVQETLLSMSYEKLCRSKYITFEEKIFF